MTTHGDECLAVLLLVQRLINNISQDHSEFNFDASLIDTLVLFLKRLCHHCWTATGGPRDPNTLVGRCVLRTAEHVDIPYLSLRSDLDLTAKYNAQFCNFINSIPSCYSLMILPLWICRFITDYTKQGLGSRLFGHSAFFPTMLNFVIQNRAYCEVRSKTHSYDRPK